MASGHSGAKNSKNWRFYLYLLILLSLSLEYCYPYFIIIFIFIAKETHGCRWAQVIIKPKTARIGDCILTLSLSLSLSILQRKLKGADRLRSLWSQKQEELEISASICGRYVTKKLHRPLFRKAVVISFCFFIWPKSDYCFVLSLRRSIMLLNFVQIGFVKIDIWISLSYMDLTILIHGFLLVVTWIWQNCGFALGPFCLW